MQENTYFPLNYSTSRLDGKLPSVFLADEVGALPNAYALEAMRSGQLTILNKLGCVISTKYPKTKNPFEDEIGYAKKILDSIIDDETVFALLYEPDDPTNWMSDDLILMHGNPLALEVPEIMEDLKQKRQAAIEVEGRQRKLPLQALQYHLPRHRYGDVYPCGGCAGLQGRAHRLDRPRGLSWRRPGP